VTGGEVSRLAKLERTLVGAAGREAQRRRTRRRRAIVLCAVAAPLALAAVASIAATRGYLGGVDEQFGALRDDRLIPRVAPSARLTDELGARPRDRSSQRAWVIAGQRVVGYTTPGGSFCYVFGSLTGGCVQPGELTSATPVAPTIEYGPRTFRIYGLAMDGVTSISLRARGATWRGNVVRNAFYLQANELGGTRLLTGALIVRLRSGAIVRVPVRARGGLRPSQAFLPILPGVVPAGDTAA
jgi:hypothetical protein